MELSSKYKRIKIITKVYNNNDNQIIVHYKRLGSRHIHKETEIP